jgi:hypothetical protein
VVLGRLLTATHREAEGEAVSAEAASILRECGAFGLLRQLGLED